MIASVGLHLGSNSLISFHIVVGCVSERGQIQTRVLPADWAKVHSISDRRLIDVLVRTLVALHRRLVASSKPLALRLALLAKLLFNFLKMLVFKLWQHLGLLHFLARSEFLAFNLISLNGLILLSLLSRLGDLHVLHELLLQQLLLLLLLLAFRVLGQLLHITLVVEVFLSSLLLRICRHIQDVHVAGRRLHAFRLPVPDHLEAI